MIIRRPLRLAAVVPVARAATLVACGGSSSTAAGVPSTANTTAGGDAMWNTSRHRARIVIGVFAAVAMPASLLITPGITDVAASSAPHIGLSVKSGPPTTTIKVTGTHFGAHEAVDVYFGTTDESLVTTNGKGRFGVTLEIPASAPSGSTWISAVGRSSDFAGGAPFDVNVNWASFGNGPAQKGVNPYENTLTPSTVSGLNEQWAFPTSDRIVSSPDVVNGVLYFGSDDDNVYAVNASTGAALWTFDTGAEIDSSPAVANGVVYIGSENGTVFALNAATGLSEWTFATGGDNSLETVVNGVVYVSTGSADAVIALKATDGTELWSYLASGYVYSSPAVVNGVVYVGSGDDGLYALNASAGTLNWRFATGGPVVGSPAVANGIVYFSSDDGVFYAINASTGNTVWLFDNTHDSGSPAVADGVVYVGSHDDNLYALAADTGAELWSFATNGVLYGPPAVADGVVYLGSDADQIYAVSAATGAKLWTASTGSFIVSGAAVANGEVYIGSGDDNMYAYSLGSVFGPVRPAVSSLHPNLALRPAA
jgi:outer membrane protein assembly factor BamB